MELFLINNDYKYAVEQMMLILFPGERPRYPEKPEGGNRAVVRVSRGEKYFTATTVLTVDGRRCHGLARVPLAGFSDDVVADRLRQRAVKQSFYRAGLEFLGKKPVWGALSGIRPGRLMSRLLDEGMDDRAAKRRFMKLFDVSESRAELCLDTSHASMAAEASLGKKDVCLYVGIPFCPTRCAYCSFVSQAVEKSMKLIEPFVEALLLDIEATARACRTSGLRAAAVYFGGGTPTTLSAGQLRRVIEKLRECFDLSACREFTVEAGRPDTITREKMEVLRDLGVTRVSVNPQTMSDDVLEAIGRRHSSEDVVSALETVRSVGGLQVNMDLIAGLPKDTAAGFRRTLDRVIALGAENITVHTLSLKKGSRITLENTRIPGEEEVAEMLDYACIRLRREGYSPYYLYRQKYMSGGFENVGWCREGNENLYNICIMEELCSIISMGAGASTKLTHGDGKLKRFFAPKYPTEYINGIDKICADKNMIKEFYHEL